MIHQYIGNADAFPILAKWQYFNHAGVSPWPRATVQAVTDLAQQWGIDCFMSHDWSREVEALRPLLGRLINADMDEIALVRNTSEAISLVSSGIVWQPGDRIVSPAVEYPSNVYPWMDVCARHGAELISVAERADADGVVRVSEDELIAAADHPRTRVLATSHVQWASGQRMNLDKLGAFCRSRGILFAVDAIQSLGVVPVDVQRSNIDFLFSGAHKWLMSPPGAGLLFCRRELTAQVNPPTVGWLSVVNPFLWELNYERKPDAGKFEIGTHAFPSLVGMRASVEVLLEIGIEPIHRQVRALGDYFADRARQKGYTVVSPREGEVGGAVCFTSPTHQPGAVVHELRHEHRTEIAARSGRMRFAPHFYNTIEQAERLVEALPAH